MHIQAENKTAAERLPFWLQLETTVQH
jgi:hypothetical protein